MQGLGTEWGSPPSSRNLPYPTLSFLKLKTTSCRYRISIKIKISMTCVYKEYEVKNGTGAMTTAKNFLLGYNMKIAILCRWGEGC